MVIWKKKYLCDNTKVLKNHIFLIMSLNWKVIIWFESSSSSWYAWLINFLLWSWFTWGSIHKILFVTQWKCGLLVAKIYVNDIMFGSSNDVLDDGYVKLMSSKFKMSLLGELKYYLSLNINHRSNEIFISKNMPRT